MGQLDAKKNKQKKGREEGEKETETGLRGLVEGEREIATALDTVRLLLLLHVALCTVHSATPKRHAQ